MYTLRQITKKGTENNYFLGEFYSFIGKDSNNDQFKEHWISHFGEKEYQQGKYHDRAFGNIIGFVVYTTTFPIYDGCSYYIMTSQGSTFSVLNRAEEVGKLASN